MAKSTNENYVPRYARGGKLSKDDAIIKALKMGVDFDKDFHAQSFGNELSELAKESGYRKSKSASGSTGRAFFEHLERIYNKNKSYYDDMANDKYSWGGGIAIGGILGGYLGYKIGRARPQKYGFDTERKIGQGIKKTFSKKKKMARGGILEIDTEEMDFFEDKKSYTNKFRNKNTYKNKVDIIDDEDESLNFSYIKFAESPTMVYYVNDYDLYAVNSIFDSFPYYAIHKPSGMGGNWEGYDVDFMPLEIENNNNSLNYKHPNFDILMRKDEANPNEALKIYYRSEFGDKYAKGGGVKDFEKGKWLQGKQWHIYKGYNGWVLERYKGDNLIEQYSIAIQKSNILDDFNEEVDMIVYTPNNSGEIKIPENVQLKVISLFEKVYPKYNFGDEYDHQINVNEYSEMYAKGGGVSKEQNVFLPMLTYRGEIVEIGSAFDTLNGAKNWVRNDIKKRDEEAIRIWQHRKDNGIGQNESKPKPHSDKEIDKMLSKPQEPVYTSSKIDRNAMHFYFDHLGNFPYIIVESTLNKNKYADGGGVGMNDFGIGDKVMYDTFRDGTKEGEILREIDDNHWEIGSGFGVSMVNKDKVVGFAPKRRFGLFEEGGNIDDIVTG